MAEHTEGQQHPIAIYLWIWGLLFVLSTFSYMVDFYQFEGYLRWSLILLFMFLKAGFIIAIFMHMALYTVKKVHSIFVGEQMQEGIKPDKYEIKFFTQNK